MKITRTETCEADKVSTNIGEISEQKDQLYIDMKTCRLIITKDRITIEFNVSRPCHDHGGTSTMTIEGLSFVNCECGQHQETRPKITLPDRWMPEIVESEKLLDTVLWALENKYGKKIFGHADLRQIARLLSKPTDEDEGNLVIHAYKNDDPVRHQQCVDIVASTKNLALILPMLKFAEEKRKKII